MAVVSETAASMGAETKGKPAGLNAQIKALSVRDNTTNWYYIGRIWAVVALTLAGCLVAHNAITDAGLHWAWHLPVVLAGLVLIGASQHELGGVLHEATHFLLFENRKLNDIAADWLAGFPLYTSIHHYRLYHLAHHQFINDPDRDPDLATLKMSHHWMDFPVTHIEILTKILKQLWLPNLFRYSLARVRGHAFDASHNPYADPEQEGSKAPLRVTVLTWLLAPIIAPRLLDTGHPTLAFAVTGLTWAAAVAYFALLPASAFTGSRLKPLISHRTTAISRVTFLTLLVYLPLTWIDAARGSGTAWHMFTLYWIVPVFTTFPLFMILRHWVHHGNADRGRYTNTRVYLVNPFIRYAIFPWGFEYHLPHHVYASVPHYRLKELHDILQDDPEYREKCVVTEGYFGRESASGRPTALGVLTEKYSPKGTERMFFDNTVLDQTEVADRESIDRAVEESRGGGLGTFRPRPESA